MTVASGRVLITGGSGFIGTHVVNLYRDAGWEVLDLSATEPLSSENRSLWRKADLLDKETLRSAFKEFRPAYVIHLAARTDLKGATVQDYRANTEGVQNIIDVVRDTPSVVRVTYASTRLVFKTGYAPKHEFDYLPSTIYGESKILGEKIVRNQTSSDVPWLLVRPTSIWGPWFDTYRLFFESVRKGRYMHPSGCKIMKSYGYVENIAYQIAKLQEAPEDQIRSQVFFLSDYEPLEVLQWAEMIRRKTEGPKIRKVPLVLLRAVAAGGDLLSVFGMRNPPLTRFRLDNLLTQMVYDLSKTETVVGRVPFSLSEGVDRTVEWLNRSSSSS